MEEKLCQSCGMPMTSEDLYGVEKDGKQNNDYCKYCYVNGNFNKPHETMEEMVTCCIPFMEEQGMKADKAKQMLENLLPKLKRWSK